MKKSLPPGRETFSYSFPQLIHQTGTAEQQIPEDDAATHREMDTDWPAVLEPEPEPAAVKEVGACRDEGCVMKQVRRSQV